MTADGILRKIDGRSTLRFERRIPHPVEKVWKAITDPAEAKHWLDVPIGEVLVCEPPKVFAWTWDRNVIRWELLPDGDGCLLVLTHTYGIDVDPRDPTREAAGWEVHLEQLDALLNGNPIPWSAERWVDLKQAYVQAFPERGRVSIANGRPRFVFDRWLAHPAERIWAALTENDQLRQWFAATIEGERKVGATITLRSPDDLYPPSEGRILEYDPPQVFSYEWGNEVVRFEVWDFGGNCRLLFTNDLDPNDLDPNVDFSSGGQTMAAWHAALDQLGALLHGNPDTREDMFRRAAELTPEYQDVARLPARTEGRSLLRFERLFGHPPARVWEALTDPGLVKQWLDPVELTIDLRLGGDVEIVYRGYDDDPMTGRIRELEPERVLSYEWGDDLVRWELIPESGNCRMIFTNDIGHEIEVGCASGWNTHFEQLDALLDTGSPERPVAPAGTMSSIDGRRILHLERWFPHPVERVWAAITEQDWLAKWFPTSVDGDRAVGAELTFAFEGEEAPSQKGTVLAYDPPTTFEFTWGDYNFSLRFDLEPEGDGCRLYFSNPFDESHEQMLRNASGWQLCLVALAAALEDEPAPSHDQWKKLYVDYNRRI